MQTAARAEAIRAAICHHADQCLEALHLAAIADTAAHPAAGEELREEASHHAAHALELAAGLTRLGAFPAPVLYWVEAAREQSRWFVQLRQEYRATRHAHRRAQLWAAGNRCRDRIRPFMAEARRMRAALAGRPAVLS